jgi:pimeloyl-ACP methyl ester carboxylesterase
MLVILHGWSDRSSSFTRLARFIGSEGLGGRKVVEIWLGDYVSMDDDVTYDDLAHAMDRAWRERKLPTAARSVDIVAHSTGALVVRYWLNRFYSAKRNPIRRMLLLAPANFGSHLAHKGHSLLARVWKGFKSKRTFNTGAKLLRGLELASPFTWQLALHDRFNEGEPWYGPGRILATVLVGSTGYDGISAAANEPGSDGTVLVSSANLQPLTVVMDFATNPKAPRFHFKEANGVTAFCRIPGDNHSTIAWKDGGPRNKDVPKLVRDALTVTDDTFGEHVSSLAAKSAENRTIDRGKFYSQGYQNTVIRVRDDHGVDVSDYFIEVFAKHYGSNRPDNALTRQIQEKVHIHAHKCGHAPSFRALRFNCDALGAMIVEPGKPLYVSLTALPDITATRSVGYSTLEYMDIGSIRLDPPNIQRLFQADRTVLVDLRIKRQFVDNLVAFKRFG